MQKLQDILLFSFWFRLWFFTRQQWRKRWIGQNWSLRDTAKDSYEQGSVVFMTCVQTCWCSAGQEGGASCKGGGEWTRQPPNLHKLKHRPLLLLLHLVHLDDLVDPDPPTWIAHHHQEQVLAILVTHVVFRVPLGRLSIWSVIWCPLALTPLHFRQRRVGGSVCSKNSQIKRDTFDQIHSSTYLWWQKERVSF